MLVALSGGPDSTALLLGLLELGVPVVAAHFDHALRAESAAEAGEVARLCTRLGVRLITSTRSLPLRRGSIQAAARAARYDFLRAAAAAAGIITIATGHTADDLVETVLMNLSRGAGLAGMRGIPTRNGALVRPLLGCWRSEVERYLAAQGVAPLHDPSNLDLRHARVRVRIQLLPRLESDRPGIGERIRAAAVRAAALQAEVEAAAADGRLEQLAKRSRPVRFESYRRLHLALGGERSALGAVHLAALDRLVMNGRSGDGIDLPGGIRAERGYEALRMKAVGVVEDRPHDELALRECTGCTTATAAHFPPGVTLNLGVRRPGLRLRPAPHGRTRKLQDVLVDAKVERGRRDALPLVFAAGELAWIPGLARDVRWTLPTSVPGLHAEVVTPEHPLLESNHQLKEFS